VSGGEDTLVHVWLLSEVLDVSTDWSVHNRVAPLHVWWVAQLWEAFWFWFWFACCSCNGGVNLLHKRPRTPPPPARSPISRLPHAHKVPSFLSSPGLTTLCPSRTSMWAMATAMPSW
jgi:hypothetical protein